jgi:predicted DNA-binding protein with PD1-like motif
MRTQLLTEHAGLRTFALVLDAGDDVMPLLLEAARELGLTAAAFTGIGAFREATLGYFELERRDYLRIPIREQVELLSLVGNVALADGEPKIHAHVVVGRRDGTALGGHLLDARVRPTLEVVLVETPATLRRTIDKTTGLPLLTR